VSADAPRRAKFAAIRGVALRIGVSLAKVV
jgi:hypothetical protein